MTRATNLGALIGLLALAVGLAGLSAPAFALSFLRQDATGAIAEIGSGPVGDRGFSVVGRAEYRADGVLLFGYLTQINQFDTSLLSEATATTVQNARFTYSAQVAAPTRQNRGDVTAYSG